MFFLAILFEATNKNLLLGFMPESLGLLIFGVGLITFAGSLRWVFNRNEENQKGRLPAKAQSTQSKTKAEARA